MDAPNYNWTCNVCESTVLAGHSVCGNCNSGIGSSKEEYELQQNPKKLHALKKKSFIFSMALAPSLPFWILMMFITHFQRSYVIMALITIMNVGGSWELLTKAIKIKKIEQINLIATLIFTLYLFTTHVVFVGIWTLIPTFGLFIFYYQYLKKQKELNGLISE